MATIKERLDRMKKRLEAYYAKEAEILAGGAQAYGIGPRSVTKYQASLADIRKAISELESEIQQLEKLKMGGTRRKVQRFVPRGW